MTELTDKTVAETILQQLGSNMFAVMTGARNFIAYPSALSFKLPSNFASNGINHVRIELGCRDTYTITFTTHRGMKILKQTTVEDVYCEDLRRVFTTHTGLDTSMGRISRV